MAKKIKVSDLSYQLTDVSSHLGLLENYLSCLALQQTQGQQDYVLVSLFHEKGIDNAMDSLRYLKKQTQAISDYLCDCEIEVKAHD